MHMLWEMERDELAALLRRTADHQTETTPAAYLLQGRSAEDVRRAVLTDPAYAGLLQEIRAEAGRLLGEPIAELPYGLFRLYETAGTRVEFERPYFARRMRLTATGLLAWLEPENPVWREAAAEIIWAICDEYTWCLPAHLNGAEETNPDDRRLRSLHAPDPRVQVDLFSAETAFALSEAAALLGPLLPPLLHKRIVQEVFDRVLRPFVRQREQPFHWESVRMNWASVCAGSIGAAAIYMLDRPELSDELADVLVHALPPLRSFLSGYDPDGACKEGYGYWQYGFGYYVYFADLLRRRTAGALDLFALDGLEAIAKFSQASFLDGRLVANFSDAHPEYGIYMGLAHYLLGEYPGRFAAPSAELRANHADDHCGRWAPAVRNVFWFRPELAAGEPWRAGSAYLPDAQWLLSRVHADGSGQDPAMRFAFAAKGGHNDEPHNQNDLGHFILYGAGSTFLADLGSGRYTRDYFRRETRYGILCNCSQGHSVPIVNGAYQLEGRQHAARVLEVAAAEDADRFVLDLAGAYEVPALERLEREFVWSKPAGAVPSLTLEDRYAFRDQPGSIVERFISYAAPNLDRAAQGIVMLDGGARQLRVEFDAEAVTPAVAELRHLDHHGEEVPVFALDFSAVSPGVEWTVRFVFRFE